MRVFVNTPPAFCGRVYRCNRNTKDTKMVKICLADSWRGSRDRRYEKKSKKNLHPDVEKANNF